MQTINSRRRERKKKTLFLLWAETVRYSLLCSDLFTAADPLLRLAAFFFHRWNNSEFAGCLWQALLAPSYSVCSLTVRTLREQSRMLHNLSFSPSHTHIALQTWQEVVAVLEELRFFYFECGFFLFAFFFLENVYSSPIPLLQRKNGNFQCQRKKGLGLCFKHRGEGKLCGFEFCII